VGFELWPGWSWLKTFFYRLEYTAGKAVRREEEQFEYKAGKKEAGRRRILNTWPKGGKEKQFRYEAGKMVRREEEQIE
jgi:hypothetical protein